MFCGGPDEKYQIELAELMLAHGADPTIKDVDGRTPVDVAQKEENPELAAFLRKAAEKPHTDKK